MYVCFYVCMYYECIQVMCAWRQIHIDYVFKSTFVCILCFCMYMNVYRLCVPGDRYTQIMYLKVRTYVCTLVCMYVCMYVRMYMNVYRLCVSGDRYTQIMCLKVHIYVYSYSFLSVIIDDSHGLLATTLECRLRQDSLTHSVTQTPIIIRHYCT